ncbi:MAG: glutathione synthase [Alphaproteobacteria bacterium]|nr:glutathione synthase [Alphaproteobacteria bacterium]
MKTIAVQMDPPEKINIKGDTTFALMAEAQARGLQCYEFQPQAVSIDGGEITALMRTARVNPGDTKNPFTLGEPQRRALREFPVVLVRQDPPFDMAYFSNTYLLELLPATTRVLNNPRAIRNTPEKLSALHFPHLMAATLIAHDRELITAFARRTGEIVLKPLSLFGGEMIVRTNADDPDLPRHLDELLSHSAEPIVAQEFLPNVKETDKRVMMLEGEVAGVLGRIPAEGNFVANIHSGGRPVLTSLTDREEKVCREVGAKLKEWDIFFAGLDLIDGRLSEINVTSPTLTVELKAVGGPDIPKLYWDKILP